MKRMNLIVNDALLKEARRLIDAESLSETVNIPLAELLRNARIKSMVDQFGKGLWQGDLAVTREDRPRRNGSKQR